MKSAIVYALGSGGGNVAQSVVDLLADDYEVGRLTNPDQAQEIRSFCSFVFADTNRVTLNEREGGTTMQIGDGRGGGGNFARVVEDFSTRAAKFHEAIEPHDFVIPIASLGKTTGTALIVPVVERARAMKKLVLPVLILPDADSGEIGKPQYNRALAVVNKLREMGQRYVVINNQRGYEMGEGQEEVYEELNRAFAHGLRSLIYSFKEAKQVDHQDIVQILAGRGNIRIGYADLDPSVATLAPEARAREIARAARECLFSRQYYDFVTKDGQPAKIGRGIFTIVGPYPMILVRDVRREVVKLAMRAEAGVSNLSNELSTADQQKVDAIAEPAFSPIHALAEHFPPPFRIATLLCTAMEPGDEGIVPDVEWACDKPEALAAPAPTRKRRRRQSTVVPAVTAATPVVATVAPASKPDKTKRVLLSEFVRSYTMAGNEAWKMIAWNPNGELSLYVNLTREDVLVTVPTPAFQLMALSTEVAQPNLNWLFNFIKKEFVIDRLIMADTDTGKSKLGDMGIHQFESAKALKREDEPLVKLLVAVALIYGYEDALLLLSEKSLSVHTVTSPASRSAGALAAK